jgi:hypothetical protein
VALCLPHLWHALLYSACLFSRKVSSCGRERSLSVVPELVAYSQAHFAKPRLPYCFEASASCRKPDSSAIGEMVTSLTGERLCVRQPLTEANIQDALTPVCDAGIRSIAVVLKHSALFPDHEALVGRVAHTMGFTHVSLSSSVMKMVKMVPRGFTAAADAYLTPHIVRYLETFQSGFDANLKGVDLSFMQSDGGLSPADAFSGHKAILSGPAAGYVGYAVTTAWDGMDASKPLQVCTRVLMKLLVLAHTDHDNVIVIGLPLKSDGNAGSGKSSPTDRCGAEPQMCH